MSWPTAEVEVDGTLVRSLVSSQFPELSSLDIHSAGEGFDNTSWRLGADFVVRLPRRSAAVITIEQEGRWLELVAGHVSLDTPLPLLLGSPDDAFPWPWLIGRWIDGTSGEDVDAELNEQNASTIATFLRQIHQPAPLDAPFNPYRSVSLLERDESFQRRRVALGAHLDERANTLWREAVRTPASLAPAVWLHGDFHPDNTIYRDGALVGVIDFGDLCAGDAATDLAGALMALPFHALDEFFDGYGLIDEATGMRTLGWATLFGVMMLELGQDSRAQYARLGQHALNNAISLATRLQIL